MIRPSRGYSQVNLGPVLVLLDRFHTDIFTVIL